MAALSFFFTAEVAIEVGLTVASTSLLGEVMAASKVAVSSASSQNGAN